MQELEVGATVNEEKLYSPPEILELGDAIELTHGPNYSFSPEPYYIFGYYSTPILC
ncbi:MAG TPA: hypothetical protein VHY84_26735 [Bryobacteraceae bacterium]|jgi:hypothetical protein|nr:hypothetical protein [Bryobacteraceae bacterium]